VPTPIERVVAFLKTGRPFVLNIGPPNVRVHQRSRTMAPAAGWCNAGLGGAIESDGASALEVTQLLLLEALAQQDRHPAGPNGAAD